MYTRAVGLTRAYFASIACVALVTAMLCTGCSSLGDLAPPSTMCSSTGIVKGFSNSRIARIAPSPDGSTIAIVLQGKSVPLQSGVVLLDTRDSSLEALPEPPLAIDASTAPSWDPDASSLFATAFAASDSVLFTAMEYDFETHEWHSLGSPTLRETNARPLCSPDGIAVALYDHDQETVRLKVFESGTDIATSPRFRQVGRLGFSWGSHSQLWVAGELDGAKGIYTFDILRDTIHLISEAQAQAILPAPVGAVFALMYPVNMPNGVDWVSRMQLAIIDVKRNQSIELGPCDYSEAWAWSPSGDALAFIEEGELVVFDRHQEVKARYSEFLSSSPIWMKDGLYVIANGRRVMRLNADGSWHRVAEVQ